MRTSETLGKIAPALVLALSDIGGVKKGATNPGFKGAKYATLEAVIDASKSILAANDIALIQFPGAFVNGSMTLETVLFHASGEWITGQEAFGVVLGKHDPQGVGSALSYARRYAQQAVLNMPSVDDDGNAASGVTALRPQQSATQAKPVATLSERADAFEKALKAASPADVEKVWANGSGLCADLDLKDPERLAVLTEIYKNAQVPF